MNTPSIGKQHEGSEYIQLGVNVVILYPASIELISWESPILGYEAVVLLAFTSASLIKRSIISWCSKYDGGAG